MSATTKIPWVFDPTVPADHRDTRALEHIAYSLDRIDTHLEAIAERLQAGNATGTALVEQLAAIVQVAKHK